MSVTETTSLSTTFSAAKVCSQAQIDSVGNCCSKSKISGGAQHLQGVNTQKQHAKQHANAILCDLYSCSECPISLPLQHISHLAQRLVWNMCCF